MAKLEKGLGDYFYIPILLRPIGKTPTASVAKLHKTLSSRSQCISLTIDQRYIPLQSQHSKLLEKRQNAIQHIKFVINDFQNEWGEFQVIYRCRYVVGVFDTEANLGQEWKIFCKACQEQNKRIAGLILLSNQNYTIEGIKQPSIMIPEKLEANAIIDFLEPWLFTILPPIQDYLCYLICQLLKQENAFIVFNKNEQKPEPRTLKRKKRGRCLKICGDFSLVLQLVNNAYSLYCEAEQILRKVDDFLWVVGCNQGKLACFTTDVEIVGTNKQIALDQVTIDCLNFAKKIKIPHLETENYFKILKIYTKIVDKFDQMAGDFYSYVLSNYASSQKFSIFTQLALLYKQAGMIRKHNYMLFLAAKIVMDLKPTLVSVILNEILKPGSIKQWPLLNANVIKLLIDNTNDPKEGRLHLSLLEDCCPILTEKDIKITLQALEHRNFKDVKSQNSRIFEIVSISCIESQVKPRNNSISQESPVKKGTGFFMNWRKKQTVYKYQQNEQVIFELKILNRVNFIVQCIVQLKFSDDIKTASHKFYLLPKMNKVALKQKFENIAELVSLESIHIKIFNFVYIKEASLFPPIRLEIYQQYPKFQLNGLQTYRNQESSLFELPLQITRTKEYLRLGKVTLTLSVYYNIQVGFQQTIHDITNVNLKKFFIVLSDYPYEKSSDGQVHLVKLQPLRASKRHIKKIQCKIDCIFSQSSKYQISSQSTTFCIFQRSIWCQLVGIKTPTQFKFNRHQENIIEDQFIAIIAIHKKDDDLTPYRICQNNKSYILSEQTKLVIEKTIKKIQKNGINSEKPIQVLFQWFNSTRQKQHGSINYQIPISPVMLQSDKVVKIEVDKWNGHQRQQIISPYQLNVSYHLVSSQTNLSHTFMMVPKNLGTVKRVIMSGKVVNKAGENVRELKNKIKIKIYFEYQEEYLIGLKFQDGQMYWFPCLFVVVS